MNLEDRLRQSLNDVLCSSGYIFEIIGNNKKQSNLLTGTNSLLITPAVTNSLARSLAKFDEVLDDTISKFNDTRWCVEQIVANKQRQKELRAKEEEKRRLDEEKKREEERKQEAERAKEELQRQKETSSQREKAEKESGNSSSWPSGGKSTGASQGVTPVFDFDFNELPEGSNDTKSNKPGDMDGMAESMDIPDPADILLAIPYDGLKENNMDLDLNNILGTDELLAGLDMALLDPGDQAQPDGNDDDFDVDSFLNQFGGGG